MCQSRNDAALPAGRDATRATAPPSHTISPTAENSRSARPEAVRRRATSWRNNRESLTPNNADAPKCPPPGRSCNARNTTRGHHERPVTSAITADGGEASEANAAQLTFAPGGVPSAQRANGGADILPGRRHDGARSAPNSEPANHRSHRTGSGHRRRDNIYSSEMVISGVARVAHGIARRQYRRSREQLAEGYGRINTWRRRGEPSRIIWRLIAHVEANERAAAFSPAYVMMTAAFAYFDSRCCWLMSIFARARMAIRASITASSRRYASGDGRSRLIAGRASQPRCGDRTPAPGGADLAAE